MSADWEPSTLCERMAARGLGVFERMLGELEIAPHAAEGVYFEPLALIHPASCGDLDAQRKLSMFCAGNVYQSIHEGSGADPTASIAEAIMMGRLAAAQGNKTDQFSLAVLLAMGALFSWSPVERHEWAAECVARLELLADEGHERSANLLASFAGAESPEVLEMAQVFRARLVAAKEVC